MRPFEGIRVIDVTHVLAGPFAAYQLAVLGADVIKVDDPNDPDQSRSSGTDKALNDAQMGTGFLTQASNKRAITLDLKTERGREILKKLVATADVFVENYRPGAFEALGLGYEDLAKINPRLIYASFSAFGQTGPRGQQTAYDHVIQATSGIMAMTGTHGGESGQVRLARDRLRHRHDRRVRAVGRAVPARAHRQGPAHRHGDARRRDDPDELASDRLPSQRRASEAERQSPSARHQRRVPDQGRPGDARREQHPPAEAAVDAARPSRHGEEDERRARRRSRQARSPCWTRSC